MLPKTQFCFLSYSRCSPRSLGIIAILALLLSQSALAGPIGVNFMTGANVGGTNGNALATTDTGGGGVYAQVNWNNVAAAQGTNVAVVDSSGAATTVQVSWTSPNTWSQSGNTTANQGTPDGNLMNPYLDNNGNANVAISGLYNMYSTGTPANNNRNWPLVYLSGMQAWLTAQGAASYDVVIYSDGDNNGGRVGEYWGVTASGGPSTLTLGADLTTHAFICDRNNFIQNQVYGEVPMFVQNGLLAEFGNFPGNYTVLSSLTNDTVLLRTQRFNSRAPINAIQIIPRATFAPAKIYPINDAPVYAGGTARFGATVAGAVPMSFQWQKNGANLTDGGNIAGASTTALKVTGVSGGDVASYALVVSNAAGSITSAPAALSIVAPAAGSFAEKISTNFPYAYWRLNDVNDPSTNYAFALDYVGGFSGIYGNIAQNGFNSIAGPQPTDWPGFESGNGAFVSTTASMRSWISAPPLNLNTNTATFCAWIYPYSSQNGSAALISARNGADVATFGYGANNNLGYTWNSNNAATFNFSFGSAGYPVAMQPPSNTWSFVALTVSPTNAILFMFNTNGQLSATNSITHSNEGWSGLTFIGCDAQNSVGNPQGRSFNGIIDELAVFNSTLPPLEVYNLYKKGLGLNAIPPVLPVQPQSLALYEGRKATFSILASGDQPFTYLWRKNGSSMSNGGSISGVTTPSLTISNVSIANDIASYDVVVQNIAGAITSSVATLSVVVSNNAPTPYEAKLRGANPVAYWRMNEANGSLNVYDFWGGNIATNINASLGVPGPEAPDFTGLETTNSGGSFDGLSAYIDTQVSFINSRGQFSILGWFNSAGTQPTRTGLFGQNDVAEFGFHAAGGSGQAQLGIWTPSAAAYLDQTNIIAGVWYLVACVGTGTNINLYLVSTNGGGGFQVLQSSTSGTTTNYGVSAYPFRIGGGGVLDATGNFFTGSMDEVAVFDRALSASELSSIFGAALVGGDLPPGISIQPSPASATIYAGKNFSWTVSAVGTTPSYQWRQNGVPISDAGNVSGTGTPTLTITNVAAGNQASYDVVITNHVGSITSSVVSLTVITPVPGSYEALTVAANPFAYYRLNETNDPSTGTVVNHDFVGGHDGLYAAAAQNGFNAIAGPVPPQYIGFDASNTALRAFQGTASSYGTAPVGSLSTNTVTFTAWLYPIGQQDAWAGLLMNRNSGVAGGFSYNDQQMLSYTWNNNNANTWGFVSGLVIPSNQWSFVAVAISPTNAVLYLINPTSGVLAATNAVAHTADVFGNNWQLGHDDQSNNNNGTRNYNGIIDEAALYLRTLSGTEILQLYDSGGSPIVNLNITASGPNVILSWPQGTLLEATDVTGPWTTNNSSSPFTTSASAARKFYKVIVR